MPLPVDFVQRNLEKARGSKIFGNNILSLTRDELIACVFAGFSSDRISREEFKRNSTFKKARGK